MATPFVRGMTFTSRVATADINSLTFQRRAEIPKSVMAKPFVRGYGEGGNPAYPNRFQSPLIPLFGLYPSSSTFPKRERKRKVYLLGRRAYYHVYCKSFVTLQSPKVPHGDLGGFRTFSPTMLLYILIQKKRWYAPGRLAQQKAYSDDSPAVCVKMT